MTAINHLQRTVDDILTQYKESSNLIGYIQAFQIQNQEIEDACNDLLTDRSLDTAGGTQLDVIGEIVGQSRIVEGFPNVLAWGYQTSAYTEGYNDGAYRDGSAQTIELDDDTYRLYIKARILRNHSQYTIDDILQAVAILVPTAESIVLTEGDMAFSLSVLDAAISVDQQNILKNGNIIPKPAGIKLDGIIFSDGPNLWQSADMLTTKVLSFLHTNVDAAWLLNDSAEWEKFDKIGSSSDPVDDPQVLKQYSPASPANVSELIGFELRDNVTGLNGNVGAINDDIFEGTWPNNAAAGTRTVENNKYKLTTSSGSDARVGNRGYVDWDGEFEIEVEWELSGTSSGAWGVQFIGRMLGGLGGFDMVYKPNTSGGTWEARTNGNVTAYTEAGLTAGKARLRKLLVGADYYIYVDRWTGSSWVNMRSDINNNTFEGVELSAFNSGGTPVNIFYTNLVSDDGAGNYLRVDPTGSTFP